MGKAMTREEKVNEFRCLIESNEQYSERAHELRDNLRIDCLHEVVSTPADDDEDKISFCFICVKFSRDNKKWFYIGG